MEDKREVKGIWIPIGIWEDKNLTWNEKILFLEIDSFTTKEKDCYFSDEYIAQLLGVCTTRANKILSSLINKGYVIKTAFDGRKRYVKSALHLTTEQGCPKGQGRVATDDNIINNNNNNISTNTDNKENKDKSLQKKNNKFDFLQALIDLGVEEQVAKDWLLVRKDKKATNTKTAFDRITKEIKQCAITPNECIAIAVERSWTGFKVEWVDNLYNNKKPQVQVVPQPQFKQDADNRKLLKIRIVENKAGVLYLEDGTIFKNNHRYYKSRDGKEYSIPVDELPRPDERYQYKNGDGWYLPFDLEDASDIIW